MAVMNWKQVYDLNPTTTFNSNDIFYLARAPYGVGNDYGFLYSSLIPVTTKGDLYTFSSSNARLPVGNDGYILTPDSVQPTGLKWSNTLSSTVQNNITAVGTIASGTWAGNIIGVSYGGTGTSTNFTPGSVVFSGLSGVYTQNNSKFLWDNTNFRLGVGTNSPSAPLHVVANPSSSAYTVFADVTVNTPTNPIQGHTSQIVTSVARTSQYTAGYVVTMTTNAADTGGHFYVGYYASTINNLGGSVAYAFYAGSGYSQLINSSSGDIVFTGYSPNLYSTTGNINLAYDGSSVKGAVAIGKSSASTILDVNGTVTATLFAGSGASLTNLNGSNISSGIVGTTVGGTGLSSYVLGDTIYASATNTLSKLAGNTTTTKMYLSQTGTGTNSAAPAWSAITGADITGSALTTSNDTNVTLTTGGTPSTALLRAASITAGWTGQLSMARGGTNANLTASDGAIPYSTASSLALLAHPGDLNKVLVSSFSGAPHWTAASFPDYAFAGDILYCTTNNIWTGLAGSPNKILSCNSSSIPTWISSVPVANGGTGTTTAFTTGSVIFAGASGVYSQDNSNFFWDATNHRLGIGTTSPSKPLNVELSSAGNAEIALFRNSGTINVGVYADVLMGIGPDSTFMTRFRAGPTAVGENSFAIFVGAGNSPTETRAMLIKNTSGTPGVFFETAVNLLNLTTFTTLTNASIASNTPLTVNGVISLIDGNVRAFNGGLATEVGAQLINYGMNDSSNNRFGGSYNQAFPGGLIRVDCRGGSTPLFQILARPTGSATLAGTQYITEKGNFALSQSSLATNATDNFPYMPTCAGTPSGVPTSLTGLSPFVYDSTNNKFYIYNSGWKSLPTATGAFTTGSVIFANSSGLLTQNNGALFWDNTNFRLGVGTSSPGAYLHVQGGTNSLAQIKAQYISNPTVSPVWIFGSSQGGDAASLLCQNALNASFGGTAIRVGTADNANQILLNYNGSASFNGTLSKGGGTFKIDHPLYPTTKLLYHSFVESPEMRNLYFGRATFANGATSVTVTLPEYFSALNKDIECLLTCVGKSDSPFIVENWNNNSFDIVINAANDGLVVSWMISGVRQDKFALANPVIPEVDKVGDEIGNYIHPELYL